MAAARAILFSPAAVAAVVLEQVAQLELIRVPPNLDQAAQVAKVAAVQAPVLVERLMAVPAAPVLQAAVEVAAGEFLRVPGEQAAPAALGLNSIVRMALVVVLAVVLHQTTSVGSAATVASMVVLAGAVAMALTLMSRAATVPMALLFWNTSQLQAVLPTTVP
jgi:hypothetical protein